MLNLPNDWKPWAVVALAAAGLIWYAESRVVKVAEKAAEVLPEAAEAVNPVNDENIFNRAAVSVWQKLTGSDETPGADLYDLFHKGTIY